MEPVGTIREWEKYLQEKTISAPHVLRTYKHNLYETYSPTRLSKYQFVQLTILSVRA